MDTLFKLPFLFIYLSFILFGMSKCKYKKVCKCSQFIKKLDWQNKHPLCIKVISHCLKP